MSEEKKVATKDNKENSLKDTLQNTLQSMLSDPSSATQWLAVAEKLKTTSVSTNSSKITNRGSQGGFKTLSISKDVEEYKVKESKVEPMLMTFLEDEFKELPESVRKSFSKAVRRLILAEEGRKYHFTLHYADGKGNCLALHLGISEAGNNRYWIRYGCIKGTFELAPDFVVITKTKTSKKDNIFRSKHESTTYDEIVYSAPSLKPEHVLGLLKTINAATPDRLLLLKS
mmetsp:Transcript_19766/g.29551  ORF Transcript_19766/g.29551 Transcript_19766/m.29551 type:complete len:229 (-) Transcript_19766:126-812(-)